MTLPRIPQLTSLDKLPDELIPSQLSCSNSAYLHFLPDIHTFAYAFAFAFAFAITFTFYQSDYMYLLPLLPSTTPFKSITFYSCYLPSRPATLPLWAVLYPYAIVDIHSVLCTYPICVILPQVSGLIMLHKALIPESLMALFLSLKQEY